MRDLPTGTVTLLFTDIEGSTHLLQQLGERYADLLAECRQLLRVVFQQWNGHEVDTQGDAFFVAFARATDAVAAAVDMQRTLITHAWPVSVTVRVRIGLHTGEPSHTSDGYSGLDVHHSARIMSAGHGGQVLLSQTTCELVKYDLPESVSLLDLGEHRLKDLQHPSRLFQLIISGLPADFPPLRTLDTHPHNLPVQPTPFIGREKQVDAILSLLTQERVRLLTLTGAGGTGKTRMALRVAAELSAAFSDGVYFVNLAPISDPELVVPTIAQMLEVKDVGAQPVLDLLSASLREKHLLLVLDNFEQVVDAAVQVADLLASCPKLKVIVTSRMALHVQAEQEFAVPPLAVPDPKHVSDLVALSHYEAVALFIQRAQAVKPEFYVSNANAPAVAEICVRLDGLPLAIELAAARIKVLPPQALLARLGQRLAVLTSGARDVPARQQTLRNTIEWSYQLLQASEQRLFRRLSIFVGGCTLEAVEAVCAALDSDPAARQILDGVASLIDKNLLQPTEQDGNEPRLIMLESIHEYGLELLSASEEMEMTRQVHAAYYLVLAERAESELQGTQQALWQGWLEHEYDNLLAAWKWAIEQGKTGQHVEMVMRLYGVFHRLWYDLGHLNVGQSYYKRALSAHVFKQGDIVTVHALAKELRHQLGTTLWLAILAQIAASQGDYATARSLYKTLASRGGDKWVTIPYLESLADVVAARGDATWAARLWGSAEALRETTGTPVWPNEHVRYERMVAASREYLGEKAFATAWAEGRNMTPEQALSTQKLATMPISDDPSSTLRVKSPTTSPDGLSVRELEVLRLLATGLTDAQIAEQLVLSLHTVHAHLRTIYSKLGVTSRSAATHYAFEHQLV